MKFLRLFTAIMTLTIFSHTAGAQTAGKKMLVVWYSWSGNTETIGKHIQQTTGADVFVIEAEKPYSSDYNTCLDEAKKDINAGRRPAIKGNVPNIADYDVVFVGTPNWWSTMAPPVATFMSEHNLAGKTIAPFVTHGGGREAACFRDMQKLAAQATFVKGYVVSGARVSSAKSDVEKWLKEIGVN